MASAGLHVRLGFVRRSRGPLSERRACGAALASMSTGDVGAPLPLAGSKPAGRRAFSDRRVTRAERRVIAIAGTSGRRWASVPPPHVLGLDSALRACYTAIFHSINTRCIITER